MGGIHKRYEGALYILTKRRGSLMKARKEYGMPGNTLRDFTRICELDIIDKEKYKTRIQQVTGNKARPR